MASDIGYNVLIWTRLEVLIVNQAPKTRRTVCSGALSAVGRWDSFSLFMKHSGAQCISSMGNR